VHLVNYAYDDELDRALVRSGVRVTVSVAVNDPVATCFGSDGKVAELEVERHENHVSVVLPELGLYSVLLLEPSGQGVTSASGTTGTQS
jgi:hypothetical protein